MSAYLPTSIVPRRSSRLIALGGETVYARSASSTVSECDGSHTWPAKVLALTAESMPAKGFNVTTGQSLPKMTSAPASTSWRNAYEPSSRFLPSRSSAYRPSSAL